MDEGSQAVRWDNDRLKVCGQWTGGTPIPKTIVVDELSGRIEWQCLGANCAVDASIDGRSMAGTGYAEKLSMTIPPWELPFRELRWGRYISNDRNDFMVWIDLRGASQRTWVWLNSGEAVAGTVGDGGVRTDTAELVLESSQPVRSGNVAGTLLGRLEFLKMSLPDGVRAVQEDKRVSACVLKRAGSESSGSSISEVLTWGRA